ncbi:hypothetical protein C5167_015117 [Papaver somniferum]|uniref:Uncharacterized protein n=1 Tax=Papaver somniferum TaxID=3469 RepID=A0A4Y7J8K1_PAPSO|nr:hypothetical protein C5167_015117 [Papaver somniferum]
MFKEEEGLICCGYDGVGGGTEIADLVVLIMVDVYEGVLLTYCSQQRDRDGACEGFLRKGVFAIAQVKQWLLVEFLNIDGGEIAGYSTTANVVLKLVLVLAVLVVQKAVQCSSIAAAAGDGWCRRTEV